MNYCRIGSKSHLNQCSSALRFQSVGADVSGQNCFIPSPTPYDCTLSSSAPDVRKKQLAGLGHSLLICGDLTNSLHKNQLEHVTQGSSLWLQITDYDEITTLLESMKNKAHLHQWCLSVLGTEHTGLANDQPRETLGDVGKDLRERLEFFSSHLKWEWKVRMCEV